MQILKKLKQKPYANNLHFFVILIVLFLISYSYPVFYILLFIYIFYIYKKFNILLPSLLIILFIFLKIFIFTNINYDIDNQKTLNARVVDRIDNGYIIKIDNTKIEVTDYYNNYLPGDIVEIIIEEKRIADKSYETDFDYKLYLYSKEIKCKAKALYSKKTSSFFSLKRYKYLLLDNLETKLSNDSFLYVKTIVFAENDLPKDLKDGYSTLGISHILAISGLHILLIYKAISFLLLKILKIYRDTIPLVLIVIYTTFLGFPISCSRAVLMLVLTKLNQKGEIQYTKLDILSLAFLIMILINPFFGYNSSFQLSFLVSFLLIFMNEIINSKTGLIKKYLSYYLIYFLTLPIVISFSNKISIFSLLFSPILSNIIIIFLLPICYILAICPSFDFIFKYVFIFLNTYISNLNDMALNINIQSFSFIMILIYYVVYFFSLFMLIKNKKVYCVCLPAYILFILSLKWINPTTTITFIDVGQGDSAIINLSHNRGVMVIDAFNSVDYIDSLGVDRIDYLVLSHSDNDHIQNADDLLKKYNVKDLLYPKFDSGFSKEITNKSNTQYVDYTNSFYLDDIFIDILGPIHEYANSNSNSIVIKLEIDGFSFLFTGDMTVEEENDLIDHYNNYLKSDVLKVGHHGSNTSSSEEFINIVNPSYSIISVGLNNKYNLPNKEIITRLEKNSRVLQTDKCGNVTFKIYKNKLYLNTYR